MTGAVARMLSAECPLTPRMSGHADDVQEWLENRLARADLPLDRAGLDQLGRAGFARYAARLYPDAGTPELCAVSLLFTWFFLVDDLCDGRLGEAPDQIRALRDGILRALRSGASARHPGFVGPLRRLLLDAFRSLRRQMPEGWRTRFTDAVAHHLDGAYREAVNRSTGHQPDVAEYVDLRRATSAAYVSYTLTEFVTRRPLPDAIYHHPQLRELDTIGNDLLSWFNDVVSLKRDQATSGGHNLVLALAREHGVPVTTATGMVADRWRVRMRRFTELQGALPSFGPELDLAVADHVAVVANSVRGTIDWSLESARYADPPAHRYADPPAHWS
ncbi:MULTISPECIES: terpene synthase family protein [unclassified Micromonospora]|uniref:terpene synthase family protein n=1 Tax=unclassified Micromonospora TaxID=2617518 RepID=UPI003640BB6E